MHLCLFLLYYPGHVVCLVFHLIAVALCHAMHFSLAGLVLFLLFTFITNISHHGPTSQRTFCVDFFILDATR